MAKPLWVYVDWSESRGFIYFEEKSLIPFAQFESTCRQMAREIGLGNGYDKVKIKVLFDDGFSFQCNLDVCPQEDSCFQKHCEDLICWIGSERFMEAYSHHDQLVIDEYEELKQYIIGIEWP
jgi:hypothetical protein